MYAGTAFFVLCLCLQASAILEGDLVQWHRYGYLVKVFARSKSEPNAKVTGCTGSVISGSLVLTSPHCLINATTGNRFSEVAVTISTLRRPKTVRAHILEVTDAWGLLRIPRLSTDMLCPKRPAPSRVAQLNVRLSLTESSVVEVSLKQLVKMSKKKPCWMTGFATTANASDFIHQDETRQIYLEELAQSREDPNILVATFEDNRTACWDDAGAALMCHLEEVGYFAVGLFHQLAMPAAEADDRMAAMEKCTRAAEMRFTTITGDSRLFAAIEQHDLPAFVDVYRACRFSK